FGKGEFAPETTEGQRLIAHELAHVVQQRRPLAGSLPTHAQAERDAGEAARAVVSGATPNVRERAEPGSVQRKPKVDVEEAETVPTRISGVLSTPKTSWNISAYGPDATTVAVVLTDHNSDPVSASAYEFPSTEPGVLHLTIAAPASGSEISARKS